MTRTGVDCEGTDLLENEEPNTIITGIALFITTEYSEKYHIHTHTCTFIHIHTHTYIHIHTHTYTYIHIHTHAQTRTYAACIHENVHTHK